ncbi:hypothetical protein EST38_g1931 [Candolleomyces aberdarensis]|uniref:chitin deacetylase n=1 Tax=Candolleomyces aberdarensis TaxID=2316362 RepID=A0A4Q2DW91_9AGAR|nr:hypothetical protein EST38_g1931 [Candolleomyces aberdarensis]
MLLSTALLLLGATLRSALAVTIPHDTHDHTHVEHAQLPGEWYQPESHPVHKLFRRAPDDGVRRPAVGSPEWAAPYPQGLPDSSQLPSAWVDALNAAVAAGRIPDIPQTTLPPTPNPGDPVNPVYPPGLNPIGPEICSATYRCRHADDIWDAPDGVFASSFDDGPLDGTEELVDFLTANNVQTTHFMIGLNILQQPTLFLKAFDAGNDIAVHTYNHPHMTTLSNLDVVAQLGWTMQIIHESTGGRVARYWRPPYGDSDNRVRAIAEEVFGLETVIWNRDVNDWRLASGGTTPEQIVTEVTEWLGGPKSPGLVVLHHERTEDTVSVFTSAFPLIAQNGWRFESLASVYGGGSYQNAQSSTSSVQRASIVDGAEGSDTPSNTTSTTSATTTTTATSATTTTAASTTTESAGPSQSEPANSSSVRASYHWTVSVALGALLAALLL